MKLRLSIPIFILIVSCTNHKEQTTPPPPLVKVVEIKTDSVTIKKDFVGQVFGITDIPIRARLDGFLEGIHFKEGRTVKKGQLLYTIDPEPYQAALAGAQSKLAGAQVELVNANNEYNRVNPLADKRALSERDRDAAIANQGARESAVKAAQANVKINQIQLEYTEIKAPTDGLIGKTNAQVGEYVGKAPNPVILNTVSNIDSIRVEFFITENDFMAFSRFNLNSTQAQEVLQNIPLELVFSDGSIFNYQGKIDFIDREVDATTGTILIQATFPNPEHLARPGQFARVRMTTSQAQTGLLVPQRCVSEFQGMYNVLMLDRDSTLVLRNIEIQAPYHDYYLIKSGLEPGDKIVLEGLQKVKPGVKVKPEEVKFTSQQAIK